MLPTMVWVDYVWGTGDNPTPAIRGSISGREPKRTGPFNKSATARPLSKTCLLTVGGRHSWYRCTLKQIPFLRLES